jgi:hypothetical protein
MEIPKVFISYSHDSLEHKKWVLDLGSRLRNNGIDSILDQWELTPGDDLPHFMEQNLSKANYIIMVCTERYVSKANQGTGGVGYEKMIITSSLLNKIDENIIIPILRQKGTFSVPTFLKSKLFIDFSQNEDYEFSFDELIRKIHKSPIFKKPVIGNNPFSETPSQENIAQEDALIELMSVIINDYESGSSFTSNSTAREKLKVSRIMFDLLVSQAVEKKYIRYYAKNDNDIVLLDGGRYFAIKNKLIK